MSEMTVVHPPMLITRARARIGQLTGPQRLVAFSVFLGIIGAALWLLPLRDVQRIPTMTVIPWWAELAACYLTSLLFVQVRVHRELSTLSLTEIPVVMGLFLVDPHQLLGCYVVGVLLASWTRQRRIRWVKDFANAMMDVVYIAVAVLVFNAVGPVANDPLALRSALAFAAAMIAAGWLFYPIALNVGTTIAQGRLEIGQVARAYAFQVAASTTNASLGIIAVMILTTRPWFALAFVPPVFVVLIGQIAAGESQRRADRNEFLYRTTEILHSTRQVGERAGELLNGLTAMFGVERAELVVIPEVRGPAVRFNSTGNDELAPPSTSELTFAEQEVLNELRTTAILTGSIARDQSLGLALAERSATAGTVIVLRGIEGPQGMLLLLNPARGTKLGSNEESLLTTVAGLISVALENGQLAEAIRAMSVEKAELARRAFYDPLTQIANRSLFLQTVETSLGQLATTRRPVAVMFIDLDGFKEINDNFGHAIGDRVLSAVAARLRVQVRKLDLAARIGGDEFGMLLDGMRHFSDAAVVADRIIETLRRPIPIGDAMVTIGASVGVAVVEDAADAPEPEELMRRADMAMYLAKRQGKNRVVVFDDAARTPVIARVPEVARQAAG
ncbi:MAG: diguanylate cyclase [Candidatus Dormibacteria bacterium]|jgi:diguanylate cyclase (GGDEF)-like protein